MIANDNGDPCPPEVELSKAVDRIEREAERVGDWRMVIEAMNKIGQLKPGALIMQRASELRAASVIPYRKGPM